MRKRFGPGRVRIKLAEKLALGFAAEGHNVSFNPERLWPASGYWKQNKQDVHRWEGQFDLFIHDKWRTAQIASWDTMTDIIKGFQISQDMYLSYEVHALT